MIKVSRSQLSLLGPLVRIVQALLLLLFVVAITPNVIAEERRSVHDMHAWYMYFGDHPLGEGPWSFHFDGQLRMVGFGESRNQLLLRPGVNFDLKDSVQLTGGYGFIDTPARDEARDGFNVPEHRLWEQAIVKQRLGRLGLVHRYRLEQRFIGKKIPDANGEGTLDAYLYKNRFRYFLKASRPLGDSRYSMQLYNELMIGFGANVQNNFFDQNRAYAALGIDLGRAGRLELGYLLQIVQRGSGALFAYNHTVQIGFFSTVPFR